MAGEGDKEKVSGEINEQDFDSFARAKLTEIMENDGSERDKSEKTLNTVLETLAGVMNQNNELIKMMQVSGQNKNFTIIPDLSKNVSDFDGEQGHHEAELWLEQVENTARIHQWPDAFTYEKARMHLKGAARYWFDSRQGEIVSWVTFKEAFENTFLWKESMTDLWKRMQQKVQGQKDSISLYFHEKVKLCRGLRLPFNEIKEQVAIGLWSKEASNYIMTRNHRNVDELFQDLMSFERVNIARRCRIKDKKDDIGHVGQKKTEERQEGSKYQAVNERSKQEETKCYNCRKMGHIARDCPEPRQGPTCYKCSGKGHIARNCRQRNEVNLVENKVSENSFQKYIKEIEINDKI